MSRTVLVYIICYFYFFSGDDHRIHDTISLHGSNNGFYDRLEDMDNLGDAG